MVDYTLAFYFASLILFFNYKIILYLRTKLIYQLKFLFFNISLKKMYQYTYNLLNTFYPTYWILLYFFNIMKI